jgi:hypothetical protein
MSEVYTYEQYLEDVGGDNGDPSAARSASWLANAHNSSRCFSERLIG